MSSNPAQTDLAAFDEGKYLSGLLKSLIELHRGVLANRGVSPDADRQFRADVAALVAEVRGECGKVDAPYAAWRRNHSFDGSLRYLHLSFTCTCSARPQMRDACRGLVADVADGVQWRRAVRRTRRVLGRATRPLLRTPEPFIGPTAPLTEVAARLSDLSGVRKKNSHVERWAARQVPIAFALYAALQGDHTDPPCLPFEFVQAVAVGHAAQRVYQRR